PTFAAGRHFTEERPDRRGSRLCARPHRRSAHRRTSRRLGRHEPAPVHPGLPGADRHHAGACGETPAHRSRPRADRDDGRTRRTHRRGGGIRRRRKHETGLYPPLRTATSIDQTRNSKLEPACPAHAVTPNRKKRAYFVVGMRRSTLADRLCRLLCRRQSYFIASYALPALIIYLKRRENPGFLGLVRCPAAGLLNRYGLKPIFLR